MSDNNITQSPKNEKPTLLEWLEKEGVTSLTSADELSATVFIRGGAGGIIEITGRLDSLAAKISEIVDAP